MLTDPQPAGDRWGEDDNARRYDTYARDYPGYQETSRDLIGLALPPGNAGSADAAVLDVACGTGATTRQVLEVLGPGGSVTGVDKSAAMLAEAARSTTDPRASWMHARAENIDEHLSEQVDAAVCNSAIWQTDVAATARAVRAVLKTGGRFALNVPAGFLADEDTRGSGDRYPSLLREMQAIAERDYGWVPPARAPGRDRDRLTRQSITHRLTAAGFEVELVTDVSYSDSAESQRAWLSIPIFTRDRLGGLPYEDRMRVLDEAYQRLGPGETAEARWVVFAAHAIGGGPSRWHARC